MIRRFVIPVLTLVAIGAAVRAALPDVARYLKIRAM
jgi:hypothetical protein